MFREFEDIPCWISKALSCLTLMSTRIHREAEEYRYCGDYDDLPGVVMYQPNPPPLFSVQWTLRGFFNRSLSSPS